MIKSVKSAIDILNCFSIETPEIRVTDISIELGLSKSTVSRLLCTLERGNLVAKVSATQKYRLGSQVLKLGNIFLSNIDLESIAAPYLKELRDKTGEMASIFVMDGTQRICIAKVDSMSEIRQVIRLGDRYPLHAGSSGKLLLAYLPEGKRKEIILNTGLPRFTPNTITTTKRLEEEMKKIPRDGYAVSNQERTLLVSSVSTPIRNAKGEVIAALCLSMVRVSLTDARAMKSINLAKMLADKISTELGYSKAAWEANAMGTNRRPQQRIKTCSLIDAAKEETEIA